MPVDAKMHCWEEELHNAAESGNIDQFKSVLNREEVKNGGNLGRKEWTILCCPLQNAAFYGRYEIIRILVAAGMDINSFKVGLFRYTALHFAVQGNHLATVKILLELGADRTLDGFYTNVEGTPLDWAKKLGHAEIIKILEQSVVSKAVAAAGESSTLPFHQLDSLKKLQLKTSKEQELREGLRVQEEINIKYQQSQALEDEGKKIQTELEKLKKQQDALKRQIKSWQGKMKKNRNSLKQAKKKQETEVNSLKWQHGYKTETQMTELRDQLKEIDELANLLRDVIPPKKINCPICMDDVKQVFGCQTCHNWVCEKCKGKLEVCPNCRQNLVAKPLNRCITTERVLGI